MFALRLTSPDSVIGMQSDDDFTIGRFTLSGTYNLMLLGAAVGVIGVAAYQCVAPRLIGPIWLRRLTVALASGAVVGSMLIHSDGIDFRLLEPTWFAIGLFVLLPAVFGAVIGAVVDRMSEPRSVETRPAVATRRARWVLPIVLVIAFPLTLFVLVIATGVATVWFIVRDDWVAPLTSTRVANRVAQACWLGVAVLGLVALVGDVRSLS